MKAINISTLKTHLSAELKRVRRGERLVVTDREVPIAELIPYNPPERLVIRAPVGKLRVPKQLLGTGLDPRTALQEDRDSR